MGIVGKVITMGIVSKAIAMGFVSKVIAMGIVSKATTIDAPDDGALEAPSLDGNAAVDAPGSATNATTLTGVTPYSDHLVCK